MASSDSTIYTCTECRANLNLTAANLYPPDFFFEAGNKGTVSFAAVDATKFRFDKEDKIRPQVVPRAARYRFKTKALRVSSGT
ncbi:hypothetical protein EV2_018771 [Malus domestica]